MTHFINTASISLKALAFIFLSTTATTTKGGTPPRLDSLTETFERELRRVISPLDQKYVTALNGIQRDYSKAKQLNEALIIKTEIERVKNGDPVQESFSSIARDGAKTTTLELTKLREGYSKAVERMALPIVTRYVKELSILQEKLTTSNDLESAVLVRRRIQEVEEEPLPTTIAKATVDGNAFGKTKPLRRDSPLSNWLQEHEFYWEGRSGSALIKFEGDTAIVFGNSKETLRREFKVIDDNVFEFDWSADNKNTFTLDQSRTSFIRHMAKSDSSSTGKIRNR